jgi:hypothetical protein
MGNVIIIERRPVFVHPFFCRHRFFTFGEPLFLGRSGVVVGAPFFCFVSLYSFTFTLPGGASSRRTSTMRQTSLLRHGCS